MAPPAPAAALSDAKAVFEGRLVSQRTELRRLGAEEGATDGPELPVNIATFEVLRVWKGDGIALGSSVTIETAGDSAACGRDYSTASEWIVYAYDQDGRLADGLCTRTGPSDAAANDGDAAALDALGDGTQTEGTAPTPDAAAPPETEASREGCSVTRPTSTWLGAAGLVCIALVSLGRPRARRRTARTPA
jgi:hypothetical protein